MGNFCGDIDSPLWNSELTWSNNTWPQFTECFQLTVLQWIPCAWFLVCMPFYAYHLLLSEKNKQPVSWLFCLKEVCSVILLVAYVLDFDDALGHSSFASGFRVTLLGPVIWMITIVLHGGLVVLERSHNVIRSPVLFLFWTLAAITTLIPFYSAFKLQIYESDLLRFIIVCVKYSVASICVLLNGFAEYHGDRSKDHNPEVSAPVISWILYCWVQRILLKGFRAPLKDEDLYDLHPRERSERVMKQFLKAWVKQKYKKESKSIRADDDDEQQKMIPLLPIASPSASPDFLAVGGNDDCERNCETSGSPTHAFLFSDEGGHPKEKHGTTEVSFAKTLLRCFWLDAIYSQWGMVTYLIMVLVSPVIIGWLINFIKDPAEQTWHGYMYALALITIRILYIVFSVKAKFLTICLAMRVRSATIGAVFRKALTMSVEARKESTTGEIINLMSVDSGHLEMMVSLSFWLWISIAFFIIGVFLLYKFVGLALLSGLCLIVIMFLGNFWVMKKMKEYQSQIMVAKDERIKSINEVLNGIKIIKLSGWEPLFIKRIQDIRERELNLLLKHSLLDSIESFAWRLSVFWMLYLMIVTFVQMDDDHYLDANTSFLTMYCIDILRVAILFFPIVVKNWIKAVNSMTRLNRFLNLKDLNPFSVARDTFDGMAVRMVNASFTWESCVESPTLKSINLSVSPGQLVAVVGPVGAGKSSLLSAMLGEMHKLNGFVSLDSSVAYVPQKAWIQNGSIRDNILFGQEFDPMFYHQVIRGCALQEDLDMMPAGDDTEIGEKGINLSGGQKQRVSLARAVYSQADIYLMDDSLSAVDSHVGRHIFKHILSATGLLRGKTRILVTHGMQWLPYVDYIFMMNEGTVTEAGTFEQISSHSGVFAQFLSQFGETCAMKDAALLEESDGDDFNQMSVAEHEEKVPSDKMEIINEVSSVADPHKIQEENAPLLEAVNSERKSLVETAENSEQKKKSDESCHEEHDDRKHESVPQEGAVDHSKLIVKEVAAAGKVKWSVYWELVKAMGVSYSVFILFLIICYNIVFNLTYIWLAEWSDDFRLANFTDLPDSSTVRQEINSFYIGVFTGFGIAQTILIICYCVLLQLRHNAASRKLHQEMLDCIMRAPMSFFDTTPIGRILNRFSQDIGTLDNEVFLKLEIALDNALRCVGTFVVISYTMPIFIVVVVPVIILLYIVQQFYIRTSCQLRRIASNNRSPVFAHFSETLSGVSVIRAYQAQDRFITDSQDKVDNFQKVVSVAKACHKWLEIWLELLSYVIITAATLFAVVSRNDLSPGLVGLAVTYALRVSTEMNTFTFVCGELETHVISVERIREYSVVKSEEDWISPSDDQTVDDQWPSHGQIQFVDYSTRYREGLDLVLSGISCTINQGERIGIVGRTGAGKSSMVVSLFRLVEATGGKITIDGVDISQIGLHTLRKKLSILPQDPVLFAGSLRMNLDPFQEKCDTELWTALENCHLKPFVEGLDKKLDYEVGEGGENLSMGQRQLVCLARTLLRKTQILILDEATAAVDMETDDLIQKTIRTKFSGRTILTIAHRLNTVIDYERIIVLDNGSVVEFGSPADLMAQPDSLFHSMVLHEGLKKD